MPPLSANQAPLSKQRALVAVLLLFALAGCVERQEASGTVVVTFATWVRVVAIAACPLLLFTGLRLPRRLPKWRWVLVGLAVVVAAIVVPATFCDRMEIDQAGFRLRTGFWFSPTLHAIQFQGVDTIWIPAGDVTASKHRPPIRVRLRTGQMQQVPVGDLVSQCLDDLASAAASAGVRVARSGWLGPLQPEGR